MIKVGVFFGGDSVEHEVSIISAVQAMENIDETKYEIVPIYITKNRHFYTGYALRDIETYKFEGSVERFATEVIIGKVGDDVVLQKAKGLFRKQVNTIDVAFPIVHGKGVEDGSLSGFLESLSLPIVGPNVLGAALGQDKVVQKQLLNAEGVRTPKYVWFYDFEYLTKKDEINKKIEDKLGYPVVIKPANLGSTIGISVAHNQNELIKGIEEATQYDEKILVEEMIKNLLELNCAVLGNKQFQETSLIARMKTGNELLTFQDKYLGNGKKGMKKGSKTLNMANAGYELPAKIDEKLTKEVEELSKKTYRILNLSGVARIDFLVDKKTNIVYVNEPNTIPGSLAFYLFKPKGKSYKELTDELIQTAIKNYKDERKKKASFKSNILSNFNGSKGIKK